LEQNSQTGLQKVNRQNKKTYSQIKD